MAGQTSPPASTMVSKLLLLGELEYPESVQKWSSFSSSSYELITANATNRTEFLAECRNGRFDGVFAAYRTFGSVSITGRIEGEVVEALASAGLKFLCHCGAGYDQVSIPDLTAHNIRVSNTPRAPTTPTADTALFLLLATLRAFSPGLQSLRSGTWRTTASDPAAMPSSPTPIPLGTSPSGLTLGIVGMGSIGQSFARKAFLALGMHIAYYSRRRLSSEEERNITATGSSSDSISPAKYLPLEELLRTADVISVHLPLNTETRHFLSKDQFALMARPPPSSAPSKTSNASDRNAASPQSSLTGAILLNTSRGSLLDEAALVDALACGSISAAGLDVYEDEPHIHPGLVAASAAPNSRCVLLPHMGTWTHQAQLSMEFEALENLSLVIQEGRLRDLVPEQRGLP